MSVAEEDLEAVFPLRQGARRPGCNFSCHLHASAKSLHFSEPRFSSYNGDNMPPTYTIQLV